MRMVRWCLADTSVVALEDSEDDRDAHGSASARAVGVSRCDVAGVAISFLDVLDFCRESSRQNLYSKDVIPA